MARGGKRPGAGRRPGSKGKKTLEKELELQYIKDRVTAAKKKIVDAQISLAQGVSFLFRIDKVRKKNGDIAFEKKPVLVTNEEEIEGYLAGDFEEDDDSYYYITAIKPENAAIDSLLDRTIGKPKQTTELVGPNGGPIEISGVKVSVQRNGTRPKRAE